MLATFLALVVALVAIWRASADGTFARIGEQAASHSASDAVGFAKDLSLY